MRQFIIILIALMTIESSYASCRDDYYALNLECNVNWHNFNQKWKVSSLPYKVTGKEPHSFLWWDWETEIREPVSRRVRALTFPDFFLQINQETLGRDGTTKVFIKQDEHEVCAKSYTVDRVYGGLVGVLNHVDTPINLSCKVDDENQVEVNCEQTYYSVTSCI